MSLRRRLAGLVATLTLLVSIAPPFALAATVTGINLELPVGLTISGRVVDGNDDAVEGAFVVASDQLTFSSFGAPTDATGAYALRGLPAGSYLVYASRGDEPLNLLDTYYAAGGSVTDPQLASLVDVGPASASGIDITMAPGLILSGRTLDANGDPVPGVLVGASGQACCGFPIASDATGAYEVIGLAPNTSYSLNVFPTTFGPFPSGQVGTGMVTMPSGDGTTIDMGDADLSGVDITLTRGNSIAGHLDGAAGKAIRVDASGDFAAQSVLVDPSGNFELTVWPGSYLLVFSVDTVGDESAFPYGYYAGQDLVLTSDYGSAITVDASGGDVPDVRASVPDLPSITGQVTGDTGPVQTATVVFCAPSLGCGSATAPGGYFQLLNLPPGDFTVRAGSAGFVGPTFYSTSGSTTDPDLATPIHISDTSITGIDIVLPHGHSIGGRITGPAGEPVVGATVFAIPEDGGIDFLGPGSKDTDANGAYELTGLVEGAYRLQVFLQFNSDYIGGFWSPSGYTTDYFEAGLITVAEAPSIIGQSPQPEATGVSRAANVTMTLSTDVTGVSKATFQVREARTNRLVPGKVTYSAETDVATFDPVAPLGRRTTYLVSVLAGITDLSGNPLAPTSWTFTTGP